MKRFVVLAVLAVIVGANVGAALACGEDIMCPTGWVWSDGEGTCVETARPTI